VVASAKLDIVRSICAEWERGDFSSSAWAHHDIEFGFADGPAPGDVTGSAAMGERWREYMRDWRDLRIMPEEYHELDGERVLVMFREQGRGRVSGLSVDEFASRGANLFHVADGKVTRLVLYLDGDRALAELGLAKSM
jgi:ketosteroid isomerase-like protein